MLAIIAVKHAQGIAQVIAYSVLMAITKVEDTAGTVFIIVKHAHHFIFALLARRLDISVTSVVSLALKVAALALPPIFTFAMSASLVIISMEAPVATKGVLLAKPTRPVLLVETVTF